MKFTHGSRRRALEYENDWVQRWKQDKTFEKSVQQRPMSDSYVFYDGPPFITGVPHHGTLLSSIVKDAVPRYQAMQGKRVERVWGWDCHGLPAEVFTEKKLGIKDRRDIGTKISLEEYITTARDNMVQTSSLWNDTIDRIGRWVDMDNAYKTMDKEYMESIWWAFKTLHEKGKIYEGERVLMYCTRDATPLSKAEVTMDAGAYQDVTDPSVYTKFTLTPKSRLQLALQRAWSRETSYSKSAASWSPENPAVGQCAISSLVVNDALGGELAWVMVGDISHYFNVIDGEIIDLTSDQFGDVVVDYADYTVESRDSVLESDETQRRYALLKRRLSEDLASEVSLLAWTTTPWTLPANTAVAVNKDLDYVEVKVGDEQFILAKELVEKVLTDEKHQPLAHEVLREMKGSELVGLNYEPLFPELLDMEAIAVVNKSRKTKIKIGPDGVSKSVEEFSTKEEASGPVRGYLNDNSFKVWHADFVSVNDGSGIVHVAPAYGEEDYELSRKYDFHVSHVIDENGLYIGTEWQGENVWEINKSIAKALHEQGIVWKIDYYRHSYPHCHRCGTRLMYRAHPSWFFDVQGQKQLMLEKNGEQIEWFPEHLKHGRFEKNIEQAPDWNLSRDRFWATAMPVWEGVDADGKKHQIVVGSYAELKELSGVELDDYHRPWVDDIEFDKDGVHYTRVDKVLDGWFESGSMPFAQFHYPFENKEKFEANFPGDFVVEYIGQVRAWFYYMHTVSIGLFGESPFKHVVTTGIVAGNDGRKMSKSYGNFTDPNELMDKFSADSLRFLLLQSPLLNGEDFALQDKDVGDVARKLSMIWNMYDFFTMYAEVDGWGFTGDVSDPSEALTNPLDQWIVSRVHQLNTEIKEHMDGYDIPGAMSPILPFIEDASNWYVRRSRRRFWKSDDDSDKNNAYRTLHYVLAHLAQILAPFTPFLSEELYHNLTGGESVHLLDWPAAGRVNELVIADMETVRDYVNQALSIRAKERMKIRQPLASVTVPTVGKFVDFEDILTEELNVKKVVQGDELALDLVLTPELKREGLMREVIRHVQAARKNAGLNVDDHIVLSLESDNEELSAAIVEHAATIASETLADKVVTGSYTHAAEVKVEGAQLALSLEKL